MKRALSIGVFAVAGVASFDVPAIPINCSGTTCESGPGLAIPGSTEDINDFTTEWPLHFDDMAHVVPPFGPWFIEFDFLTVNDFGANLYTFNDAWLTDMDTIVPPTAVALLGHLLVTNDTLTPGEVTVRTDWDTLTAEPVYMHDLHIVLNCQDNCQLIDPIALDRVFFRGGAFEQGVWMPEPATVALLAVGFIGLGFGRRATTWR